MMQTKIQSNTYGLRSALHQLPSLCWLFVRNILQHESSVSQKIEVFIASSGRHAAGLAELLRLAGARGASPGMTGSSPIIRVRAFSYGRQLSSVSSIPGFWATLYEPDVDSSKPLPPLPQPIPENNHKLVKWSQLASMPANGIKREIDLLDSGTRLREAGFTLLTCRQTIMTRLIISIPSFPILRHCPQSIKPLKHSRLTKNGSTMKSKTSTTSRPLLTQNVYNVSRLPRRSWQSCSRRSMAFENELSRRRRISRR